MKTKYIAARLALLMSMFLFLAGTDYAQEVRYNFVPGTDFSKYKTYAWVEVPGAKYPNEILDGQIKQAIDSQLALRGMTKAAAGSTPDVYAAYQLSVTQDEQWNAYSTGGGMGWGYRGRWGGTATTTVTNTTVNIGTLVLDIYDVAAKSQVWTGRATKQLNPSKDQAKNQKSLQKAMAKLLKNYPPAAK
jgi:hypothetical protein